ncbi:hypothetical protein BDU57DRAFT_524962 [Ampelomyces quisqualis]|uniref:Uncharacterized protein n=1 Tax=Ampelomyces quisqualis TaxID=50730 RepID=A0A6A5Q6F7_AMPQU|nr:hypothetical protein BDU57DRAFT_524962 [Ampelomyces quisqualis]
MLDMLLAADAARKHGHEASPPHAPSSLTSNVAFLAQTPLSMLGSVFYRQTPSPSFDAERASHVAPTCSAPEATTPKRHVMPPPPPPPPLPDAPLESPAPSRPVSSGSSAATDDTTKKRVARPRTSYICARPVRPTDCIAKLHIRPKVVLQLHQIVASQRPKPTYDVVPFSLLPPRSTRRLARTFNTRERLGPNDLLIVKAEAYDNYERGEKTDDDWGSREVVGVICPAKNDKGVTDICMDDGASRWEVTNMANRGFEFNTTDAHGLTLKARWVLKPAHSRRVSGTATSEQDDRKYTFSTISATSRRHPIIATMTRRRIDVMDSYTMPSATSPPTFASLPPMQSTLTSTSIDAESILPTGQKPIHTDDALRRFILVTGVWVASQSFCSTNTVQPQFPSLDSCTTLRALNSPTISMSFLDSPRSASPASPVDENHRSLPRLLRAGRERLPRSTSFTEPSPSPVLARATTNASPVSKTRSRRANSTGNTNLHSMSGSMRKRYGLAFEDQTLEETEEERQVKRSVELLRIKELATSITERPSCEIPSSEPTPRLTVLAIPSPIVTSPSSDASPAPIPCPPLLSPPIPDPERFRKTQSAYNPVTTAGLWDSGVSKHPGLKSRPTSMSVVLDKQKKQDQKRERSKTKEDRKYDNDKGVPSKKHAEWHRLKASLKSLFTREKA